MIVYLTMPKTDVGKYILIFLYTLNKEILETLVIILKIIHQQKKLTQDAVTNTKIEY